MSSQAIVFEAPPVVYWNSNPYGLAFSPDGSSLAIGSGGWYGCGGISLVDVASGSETTLRFVPDYLAEGVPVAPFDAGSVALTISGVAFDASGEFLGACAWSSSQHCGPAILFRVGDRTLEHQETFLLPRLESVYDRCPTGVGFFSGQLVVRNNARRVEDVFCSFPVPEDVDTEIVTAHRAHARMACAQGRLITGGGGSLKLGGWSVVEGEYEDFKATTGLVVGPPYRGIPAPGQRITAVLARPDGRLVTGGLMGELHLWERDGEWRPVRLLRSETDRRPTVGGAWATYHPQSVVGLCALEDGRFFSVDASGEVLEWHEDAIVRQHPLPGQGTPRCVAVHPNTPRGPLLAVGVKAGEKKRRGYVACVPLD